MLSLPAAGEETEGGQGAEVSKKKLLGSIIRWVLLASQQHCIHGIAATSVLHSVHCCSSARSISSQQIDREHASEQAS